MGAVAFAKYQDGNLAAILVLTFTAVSGLVSPLPRRRSKKSKRERREAATSRDGPRLVESLTG